MAEEGKVVQPIIVKRIKKGGGHHGGAWKVAYADFVTAMMAFFLLLWLLNVTTEEEKNAISNYFDPTHPKVSESQSGAGGVMGGLTVAPEGAMVSTVQPITAPPQTSSALNNRSQQEESKLKPQKTQAEMSLEKVKKKLKEEEEKRLKDAQEALKKAIENNPELKEMKDNLVIDMTPEGLRIQIIDQEGKPMFPSGSARMFEKTQMLLRKVGEIILTQPNELSIRGHTDNVPYGSDASYTNWELSADRANASRRVLLDGKMPPERINNVVGKADTEHLAPEDPKSARNRRISIILLKEELTNPDYAKKIEKEAATLSDDEEEASDASDSAPSPALPKMGTFKKTPGAVEFP
jgi:chemotaxis protein MotB